jgi:hypothetical protein
MLKAAFLPETVNLPIRNQLKVEFVKVDYLCFVNEVMFYLRRSPAETPTFAQRLMTVINKILLDNIFKHVIERSTHRLVSLLTNHTFHHDLFINTFYTNQILELVSVAPEDQCEVEHHLIRMLHGYLNRLYTTNRDNLDESIFTTYEYMNNHFQYLDISYYKFELADTVKPILLYTERKDAVCTY